MSAPDSTATPLRVLSLGAGVQSTTLLLMSLQGDLEPLDAAVFADTGWERAATYAHLDWLTAELSGRVPLYRVSTGDLRRDTLTAAARRSRFASLPLFVRNREGEAGMLRRQCTAEYKITPITKQLRLLTGRGPRARKGPQVELWKGISLDEYQRMRRSDVAWITARYPLVERRMTRHDCLCWLAKHGYPPPPRSSCIGCPFHTDTDWRMLRAHSAAEWAGVVAFDAAIRTIPRFDGECFLHDSLRPLAEVDLSTREDHGQLRLPELCDGGHCFT